MIDITIKEVMLQNILGDSWNNFQEGLSIFLFPVLLQYQILCCWIFSIMSVCLKWLSTARPFPYTIMWAGESGFL